MESRLRDRRVTVVALGCLALVALLLRLAGTGERTLSWDEAYHVRLALMPDTWGMLGAILGNPPSDPLYALLLRGWVAVLGAADAVVRLPSAVAGAVTVMAAAWLGWELTRNRLVALVAAVLVALSPYVVEFAQEATLYTFATLWATLALAAGGRWRRSGERRDAVLSVLFAIFAVYSHYVAAPILGLAALISILPAAGPRRATARELAIGAGIVVAAWLPWLLPMAAAWLSAPYPRTAITSPATLPELGGALSSYATGTGALLERERLVQIVGVGAAALLIGRGWLVGKDPALCGLRVVSLVAGVLFIVPWVASAVSGKWLFIAHLMLPLLPALSVVAAAGAVMPGRLARMAPAALAALVAAQVAGVYVDAAHPPHGDEGVHELAQLLNRDAQSGQPILVTPAEHQLILERYLTDPVNGLPADIDLARLYVPSDSGEWRVAALERFDALTAGATRAWLVYGPERDQGGLLLRELSERGQLERVGDFELADLYVLDLR